MTATATDTVARAEALKAVVKKFFHVHQKWQDDRNRPNPDLIYWEAVNAMVGTFEDEAEDMPASCRRLADAVNRLREEADAFEARENTADYYPKPSFWRAVENLEAVLNGTIVEKRLPPLESIKDLHEQKVSHAQIAKMYGLYDSQGNLQVHLVQRELDQPGSVINDDWSDPRLKERQSEQEDDEYAGSYEADAADRVAGDEISGEPCPESAEELWEQGVSIEQAAKMLKLKPDEVRAMFEGFEAEREEAAEVEPEQPAAKKTKGKRRGK